MELRRFHNILCALTPAEKNLPALARAVSLAASNQAPLTVVEVIPRLTAGYRLPDGGPASAELQRRMRDEHLEALEAFTAPYRQDVPVRHEVLLGTPFLELIRTVLRKDHDLLIKPAENPGYIERLFGSDDMHLLRKCPCPLWLTRPGEKTDYERVLAAVDFELEHGMREAAGPDEELNAEILDIASSIALSDFAELQVLHIWDAPAEDILRRWNYSADDIVIRYVEDERSRHQGALDALSRSFRERIGADSYAYINPRFRLRRGSASREIPAAAASVDADLVVMGTLGRAGIAGLFIGNTAEAVLEQLQCSVLALKPPGFVTPVQVDEDGPA